MRGGESARGCGASSTGRPSLVYVLGVVHALGAGTDASTLWLRAFMLVTGAPILFLFLVRDSAAPEERGRAAPARAGPALALGREQAEGRAIVSAMRVEAARAS